MSIPNPYPNIADKEVNDVKTWSSAKIIDELQPALDTKTTLEETYEGNIVTFNNFTNKEITSLDCEILSVQSGTDELTLKQTGANLWNFLTSGQSVYPEGVDEANKTISWRAYGDRDKKMIEGLPFKANTQYTFILKLYRDTVVDVGGSYGANMGIKYTDETTQLISYICEGQNVFVTFAVTSTANKTIDSLYVINNGGNTVLKYEESGVFEGVLTTSDFEPYNAETYTVTLEETAYGGNVDVIAGSGQIIDEHGDLIDITFTPVSISALEGINNVWCDTGNIKVTIGETETIGNILKERGILP